jgi:hypothetical protein
MLSSLWQSSHHCRYRGAEEIAKALDAGPLELRVQHLDAARHWYERAEAIGDQGIWDRIAPPDDPESTAKVG